MKKLTHILLCMIAAVSFAGCGSASGNRTGGSQSPTVNEVLEAGKNDAENTEAPELPTLDEVIEKERQSGVTDGAPEPEVSADPSAASTAEGIDIDLTTLSSTLVYSEVFTMMSKPQEYVGKTIRMNGTFSVYHDAATDQYYFSCVVADATACCAQGIEFIVDGYSYPDDYPDEGKFITVTGVFDTYQEGNYTYCTLRKADLVTM